MKVKVKVITTTEATTTKVSLNAEELKVLLKEMKQEKACTCKANTTPAQTQTPAPEKPVAPVAKATKEAVNTPAQQAPTPTEKPVTSKLPEEYREAKAAWEAANKGKVFATGNVHTNPAPETAKTTKEADNDKPTDPQAKDINEENLLEIPEELMKVFREIGVVEVVKGCEIIHMYEDKPLADVLYGDTKDKALFDTIVSFENHGISVDDVCNGVYDYYRNGSVVSKHKVESEFRLRGIEAMFNAEYKKRGGKGYVHITDTYRGRMYVTYPVGK